MNRQLAPVGNNSSKLSEEHLNTGKLPLFEIQFPGLPFQDKILKKAWWSNWVLQDNFLPWYYS